MIKNIIFINFILVFIAYNKHKSKAVNHFKKILTINFFINVYFKLVGYQFKKKQLPKLIMYIFGLQILNKYI